MLEADHRSVVGDPAGHPQGGGVWKVGHRMQRRAFLGEHLNRAATRGAVYAGIDLGDELRACGFDVGERGVVRLSARHELGGATDVTVGAGGGGGGVPLSLRLRTSSRLSARA